MPADRSWLRTLARTSEYSQRSCGTRRSAWRAPSRPACFPDVPELVHTHPLGIGPLAPGVLRACAPVSLPAPQSWPPVHLPARAEVQVVSLPSSASKGPPGISAPTVVPPAATAALGTSTRRAS